MHSGVFGPAWLRSSLSAVCMSAAVGKFLVALRRGLACLWAIFGIWLLSNLRYWTADARITQAIGPLLGLVFIAAAVGLLLNHRWGRICMGLLMVLVVLWCADMLLFLAFRGYHRQSFVPLVLSLPVASVSTWIALAYTKPTVAK